MQLVLMVTAKCNASCSHCSTSCGPRRTEHLGIEAIERLIREGTVLAEKEPLQISITGGEPFLDFTQLLRVVAYGTSLGAIMSCVSNGYWATSPEAAEGKLKTLKDAGLSLLAISTSSFHERFVSRKRVRRALDAARRVGLECVLKFVRTTKDGSVRSLRDLGREYGATRTEVIPLMPTIRDGASLPETAFVRREHPPEGPCPGAILNISETGRAYMCCTPGAINDFFTLGNINDSSLATLHGQFLLGTKQHILRTHGPQFFAKAAQSKGLGSRLRERYANVCDLCTHIASDSELAAVATAAVGSFAADSLSSILVSRHHLKGEVYETDPA